MFELLKLLLRLGTYINDELPLCLGYMENQTSSEYNNEFFISLKPYSNQQTREQKNIRIKPISHHDPNILYLISTL